MNAELERRKSYTDKLEAFFRAHPNEWINAVDLEPIGGRQAWRTRVSECRKRGMRIDNHVVSPSRLERDEQGRPTRILFSTRRVSLYRFVPRPREPLGRDAGDYVPQKGLFDGL